MADKFPQEFGDYRLLRKVAQGGMAEIFLAQGKDGQICALKRILPHLAHQEGFIRMFIDEARIVSHLDHSNVAGVYAQGKHDGFYYIAMEYVEGHSILALQDQAKRQKMALPFGLLAYIVAELLGGLGYAHSARDAKGRHLQIVHRDVTPQNVLVAYDGVVKLIDFGVAKARARLTQTEAGFTKGKLSYMSPEQARGEPLDGRSDLFSVGIILYEITTKIRLFNKDGPGGILSAIVNDPITPPTYKNRKYPKDLEAIVMRALDKDPERRWQTAEDMRDALLRFARRERPRPGKSRLRDLVYDLFGEPKHQSLIAAAQAVVEPTPPEGSAVAMVEGESIRVGGTKIPNIITDSHYDEVKPDETRMMDLSQARKSAVSPSLEASEAVQVAREVTSDGTPIVDLPLELDDISVPEPRVPGRVRLAKALSQFAADARESWRAHTLRYVGVFTVLFVLLLVAVGYATGLNETFGAMMSSAVKDARRMKEKAGLDPTIAVDAGVRPTVLRVKTEPPGALISIDGVGAGCVTPCDVEDLEPPLRVAIELAMSGFRPVTEQVTLRKNEGVRELEVSLERQVGTIRITTDPPDAVVYRNGRRLKGSSPITLDGVMTDKPVQIAVKKSGFIGKSRVVIVRDGEMQDVAFSLEIDPRSIKPGTIEVSTNPAGCSVAIEGESIGVSPVVHTIEAGTYSVSTICDNYAPGYQTVTVRPGGTSGVSLSLDPNVFGYLTIAVQPSRGSTVRVNGQSVRLPVQFLKVIPGRHEVEVANDALRKNKRVSIRVGPNQRVSRTVNLLN